MRNFVFIIAIFLSVFLTADLCYGKEIDKPQANKNLFIKNVRIISPESNKIKSFTGNVLITNGLISYVGKKKPSPTPNTKTIDGIGKYLIPGLIDSHVHLANIAGLNFRLKRKHPQLAKLYYKQLPKSFLYFGYTTLIDLNNHSPKILGSILKEKIKPDIFTCGEQVEVMNGFMMAETKPANRYKYHPNFLHDRFNKNVSIKSNIQLSKHTPKASIKRIKQEQNGICSKIAFENGFGGTEEVTWEMPSKQIIKELTAEAKKENIPVLLHANSFESQQFAYDTNINIIAHGMWHWGLIKDFLRVKKLPKTHKKLLRKLANRKTGYQPTFRVIAGQRDVFDDDFLNDSNLEKVYPQQFLEWLKTDEGKWQQKNIKKYAKGFFDGKSNSEIMPFMQLMVDKIAVSTKVLADKKGNLLLGSDTPSSNTHTNPPGYNGYLEMKEWFKARVSLKQILRAATINNAKAFHIENKYGSVETGKKANLLLLDKNPLKEISAYNSINSVILNGKIFYREEFLAK